MWYNSSFYTYELPQGICNNLYTIYVYMNYIIIYIDDAVLVFPLLFVLEMGPLSLH